MDRIRKAAMLSKCGHRFCVDCITKTLLIKQTCPCCNGPAHTDDLLHDHQFEGMSEIFHQMKEDQEKRQFEAVIQRTLSEDAGAGAGGTTGAFAGRIQEVLRVRLRDVVAQFMTLAEGIERRCDAARERVREERAGPAAAAAAAELPADAAERLANLDRLRDESVAAIAAALDRHLDAALPRVAMLPVAVVLSAPSLNVRIATYLLRPTDTCADLRAVLIDRAQQDGRKAVATDDAVAVELRHGFDASPTRFEGGALPLLSGMVVAGAELALVAGLASAVEHCFVDTFAANPGAVVDYFSCKECGVNWICASCAPACHRGHTVVPHLKAHKSEWACCYCARKCKCTLRKKT